VDSVHRILVTDFAWKDLQIEREILRKAGAEIQVVKTGEEAELVEIASTVDGILTCWKPVSGSVIRAASRCLSIGRFGIGLDNIDIASATVAGIIVTNVPAYCVDEVSDHALALILTCARKTAFYDRNIKAGSYDLEAGPPLCRIRGKALGIAGFGKIGRAVAGKAQAFGMTVITYDPNVDAASVAQSGAESVSFSELLERSDFISVHVPLLPETKHLFNHQAFQKMKRTAIIVNTSRGDLIDPSGLLAALDEGLITGAGLDVLSQEPPAPEDRLVTHPRTVITPHAAFNSQESVRELRETTARQMADVLSGRRPQNIVNPEVLKQHNLRWRPSA
jgi:D-3-phosphoglycerate dehydrogenase / 2-oxoglutarate reductase